MQSAGLEQDYETVECALKKQLNVATRLRAYNYGARRCEFERLTPITKRREQARDAPRPHPAVVLYARRSNGCIPGVEVPVEGNGWHAWLPGWEKVYYGTGAG